MIVLINLSVINFRWNSQPCVHSTECNTSAYRPKHFTCCRRRYKGLMQQQPAVVVYTVTSGTGNSSTSVYSRLNNKVNFRLDSLQQTKDNKFIDCPCGKLYQALLRLNLSRILSVFMCFVINFSRSEFCLSGVQFITARCTSA